MEGTTVAKIKKLVQTKDKKNLSAPTKCGSYPLHILAASNRSSGLLADVLRITECTNVNPLDSDGCTPLHIACRSDCSDIVTQILKSNKADLSIKDNNGETPLIVACKANNRKIIKALLEREEIDFGGSWGSLVSITNYAKDDEEIMGILENLFCKNIKFMSIHDKENLVSRAYRNSRFEGLELEKNNKIKFKLSNWTKDIASIILGNFKDVDINAIESRGYSILHHICDRSRCEKGDSDLLEFLISKRIKVGIADKDGALPLYLACKSGENNLVKILLGCEYGGMNGVNISSGKAPIHVACEEGHTDVVRTLVEEGAMTDIKDSNGDTPMHVALNTGNTETFEYLISVGADMNIGSKDGQTPFHIACKKGYTEIIKSLYNEVNIETKDSQRLTALHVACGSGNRDITKLLLKSQSIRPNKRDAKGMTPLHIACAKRDIEMVKTLLGNEKVIVNITNKKLETPLHVICKRGSRVVSSTDLDDEIISYLLKKGANINSKTSRGSTPLHVLCRSGRYLPYLVSGENINLPDERGIKPLHMACVCWSKETITSLFNHGAVICEEDMFNIIKSLCMGNKGEEGVGTERLINYLISKGLNTDSICPSTGNNIFHTSVIYRNIDMVRYAASKKLLLIDDLNNNGRTPLQMACTLRYGEIIEVLVGNGAMADVRDLYGNNLMHIVASAGEINMEELKKKDREPGKDMNPVAYAENEDVYVRVLNQMGSSGSLDHTARDELGNTPLYYACHYGCSQIVRLLISFGAQVNDKNENGNTALHISCLGENENIVRILCGNKASVSARNKLGMSPADFAKSEDIINFLEKSKKK